MHCHVVSAADVRAVIETAERRFGRLDVLCNNAGFGKVEPPSTGDPMRTWGDRRDGIGLVWKSIARNKKCVTLDLREPDGQRLLHRLLAVSDVLVCGTRPGTLARWGLDYETVHAAHPHLVYAHITGYGGGGPKSDRPGYGTLAEAMSGFAQVTGRPDGPPTLPPFMLADGVAGMAATYAVMMALYHRDVHGGQGQLVDVSLLEPLARLVESSTLAYDQLGAVKGRVGNRLDASAPRNAYRTADGRWLAVSSASPSIAVRVFRAIGRQDLAVHPDYVDPVRRQERALEVDRLVADWVARRTLDEAMAVFEAAEVTAAPVYRAPELLADEHLRARGTYRPVDDPDFGRVRVQAPSPASARHRDGSGIWAGPSAPTTTRCTGGCSAWRPPRSSGCGPKGSSDARAESTPVGAGDARQQRAHVRQGRRPGADLVFLDLEDACAPAAKQDARRIAVRALTGLDWGRTVRAVRVNGLDTRWCHDDVIEVVTGAREPLEVIIVPKARTARDVWWVDVLLTQLEDKLGLSRRIGLEVLVEEAEGLPNAVEIARSSPRLEAVIFGAGDLSASLHASVDGNFDPLGGVPGRLLAPRAGPGAHRRPRRRDRRDRRPLPRLPEPRRLPAGRRAREPARLRRQVGHPSRPGAGGQRGLRAHTAGDRAGPRGDGGLPPRGRGRHGRHRPGRAAGRRRPHAPGRQRAAQGGPGGRGTVRLTARRRPGPSRPPGAGCR